MTPVIAPIALSHAESYRACLDVVARERKYLAQIEALPVERIREFVSASVAYTATGTDGRHLHKEATLLAMGQDGRLCLWPVMEELPFVLPHPQVSNGLDADGKVVVVFASGPREATDVFREEIAIEVGPDGELGYAHSWGMPRGPFEARSRCVLRVEV